MIHRPNPSRRAAAALACAVVVLLAGCSSDSSSADDPQALDGEVSFGVLAPLSGAGDLAARGQDLVDGAQLAADEINAAGGLLGHKVVLTALDDACMPNVAYEAAKSLANTGVLGVVGGLCDESTAKEIGVIDSVGIPFLVTSANGPDLVNHESVSSYLMNGTHYQQARSAVHWMGYDLAQRLVLLSDGSEESELLAQEVATGLDQAPELVGRQVVDEAAAADLAAVARTTLAARPDFVLWTGSAAGGGAALKALRAAGYDGTFTATAASDSPEFVAAAGEEAAEGAYVTATPTPDNVPIATEWNDRFRTQFDRDPTFEALQAYDGIRALIQATRQAGSTDPAGVLTNLTQLDDGFTTYLGTLRFARDHLMIYDNRIILVVKDGALTFERSLRTDI